MKKIAYLVATLIFVGVNLIFPHTDIEGSKKILELNMYKNIKIGGYGWFASKDWYSTKFTATSPSGIECSGVITKGFFENGSTIRLND